MIHLSKKRITLSIIANQIGGQTRARYIASACLIFMQHLQDEQTKSEIYHLSDFLNVSWAEFAFEIFARSSRSVSTISITTAQYPVVAKRPHNSRIDCSSNKNVFGIEQLHRREGSKVISRELEVTL